MFYILNSFSALLNFCITGCSSCTVVLCLCVYIYHLGYSSFMQIVRFLLEHSSLVCWWKCKWTHNYSPILGILIGSITLIFFKCIVYIQFELYEMFQSYFFYYCFIIIKHTVIKLCFIIVLIREWIFSKNNCRKKSYLNTWCHWLALTLTANLSSDTGYLNSFLKSSSGEE